MAALKSKRYEKSIAKPTTSSVEFIKIYRVMDKRLALGYSAYELSFLLGKQDFFIRDAENPLNTKRYNIDDTNYLLLIFNEQLSSIAAPKIEQDIYHLEIVSYFNGIRAIVYEIAIKDNKENGYKHFKTFEVERKHADPSTSLAVFSFKEVQLYIDTLLASAFFNAPKRALDIFESCKAHFGKDFHPRNMIKVLNFYTNKKSGMPNLRNDKRDNFGRRIFGQKTDN